MKNLKFYIVKESVSKVAVVACIWLEKIKKPNLEMFVIIKFPTLGYKFHDTVVIIIRNDNQYHIFGCISSDVI